MLKTRIKQLIPKRYSFLAMHYKKLLSFNGFYHKSYSNSGEDTILTRSLFPNKKNGFYVDIGSYHPLQVSNTYRLHKRGWRGINVDPNTQTQKLFIKYRPHDINIELGVADANEKRTYFNFSHNGISTLDKEQAEQKKNKSWSHLLSENEVSCVTLKKLFDDHLPKNINIDLLDIDVEGLDIHVLKSNDWDTYRPSVILVEDVDFKSTLDQSRVFAYLTEKNYKFHSYVDLTLIMTDKDFTPH